MTIYTSYYGKRDFGALVPVSISIWPPKGYSGLKFPKIAPTAEMLREYKRTGNEYDYKYHYWHDVLKKYNPTDLYLDLEKLTDGKDCVLLCFEKPDDFCHRHLFATWMNKNGYDIKELKTCIKDSGEFYDSQSYIHWDIEP